MWRLLKQIYRKNKWKLQRGILVPQKEAAQWANIKAANTHELLQTYQS